MTNEHRTGMLERAKMVLDSFGPQDVVVSPTTLAKRAGLSKATGHRIIAEMVNLGFLEKTAGGVRIGLWMFEVGQLVPQQRSLRRCAAPVMQQMRDTSKLSAHLAVLDRGDTLYIDIVSTRSDLPSSVGGRLPAYATGVGKAMLSYSPPEIVQMVTSKKFRKFGPGTLPDGSALRKEIAEIRQRGVAYDNEESSQGTACVAAAIRRNDGSVHGGISLTGHVGEVDFRTLTPLVLKAAAVIGQNLDVDAAAHQHSVEKILSRAEQDKP